MNPQSLIRSWLPAALLFCAAGPARAATASEAKAKAKGPTVADFVGFERLSTDEINHDEVWRIRRNHDEPETQFLISGRGFSTRHEALKFCDDHKLGDMKLKIAKGSLPFRLLMTGEQNAPKLLLNSRVSEPILQPANSHFTPDKGWLFWVSDGGDDGKRPALISLVDGCGGICLGAPRLTEVNDALKKRGKPAVSPHVVCSPQGSEIF